MSIEASFKNLPEFPTDPSPSDIKKRIAELSQISKKLDIFKKRLSAEYELVRSMCNHSDSYSSNWCGRDPGGGRCNTCGESW